MKEKIPYQEAKIIADDLVNQLRDHCERIEIAGSIRRKKTIVGDIEIVAIPKPYENDGFFVSGIAEVFNQWQEVKTGKKYTQRILPSGIKLDLFFAVPENWGWIFALRTGSSEFNFKYLEALKNNYLMAREGYIYTNHPFERIPVYEEIDFFNLIKMPFIEPENRKINC